MAESSTHINYTFEDIQRYLQGKMSAAEMHNIEKSALQDPFLADAIEGYKEVDENEALKHLNDINAGLFVEKKKAKVVSLNKKTQWLSIAAMIIVISGVALLGVYMFNNPGKRQEIAQVKKEADNNTKMSTDSAVMPLKAIPPEIKKEEPVVAQNQTKSKIKSTKKNELSKTSALPDKEMQAEANTTTNIVTLAAPVHKSETASKSFANADVSNQKNDSVPDILPRKLSGIDIAPTIFAGKVTDEKHQPVAGAVVESTDKSITVLTDGNGYFRLWKSDTILNATASTVGYESKTMVLQPGDNNSIMLKQGNSASNDVVVVGYGTQKKKIADTAAVPVGGWKNFNNYVLTRLNKDTTTDAVTDPDDLVEIEFLIDKTGNPYDFKVVKPLDEQRNAKAIEILKSGPKWTNTSRSKKARVRISF